MKLGALQVLHAKGETADASSYALNGQDGSRLRKLVENPGCSCGCAIPFKVIAKVCASFWGLPKEAQDAFLWSLQIEAGRGHKNKFSIEGQGWLNNVEPTTTFYLSVFKKMAAVALNYPNSGRISSL